jgi:DNA (cytosine-5)-methyltransferase 1
MDVGFERAGFGIVFANELDHDAAETWQRNREKSSVMVEGDIQENLYLLKAYEGVEVLFGGPPCQGFSVAGKMDPADPRSALIFSFLEAVEIAKPKVFVMENVKALGGLTKWSPVRNRFLDRAEEIGYQCFYRVFSATAYGTPQKRERVVFIGVRDRADAQEEDFVQSLDDRKEDPLTIREVFGKLDDYGTTGNQKTCTANVSLALHPVLRRSPYAGMLVNGAGRPMDIDGVSQTLPASMGGNQTPIIDQRVLDDPGSENWFVEYHASLLKGKADPRTTMIPERVRRLTLTEAAALQTFPTDYVFCGKKTAQYKQIGNAVACKFANAVAEVVKETYL